MAIQYKRIPGDDDRLMSDINTTPLVDVMLVLLIIFLITIPVVNSSVAVQLPRESVRVVEATADTVLISVDAQSSDHRFETPLPDQQALLDRLSRVAAMQPQPEVHIRADARAEYAPVGRVVLACQQMGIARVGFVAEAPPR